MNTEIKSTVPKPFIFVLMPLDKKLNDTYKFGIKGAAEDAGAYAERVDEQIFYDGILDRVFNQINKADVIVADMTGRNPNVFYEVGYAHALGKIVILLTQNADDIPFNLKHRQHIVYAGQIETLRKELTGKLIWAIAESKRKERQKVSERSKFIVSISGIDIPEAGFSLDMPTLTVKGNFINIRIDIRNDSLETTPATSFVYLFTSTDSKIVPGFYKDEKYFPNSEIITVTKHIVCTIDSASSNSPDGLTRQYHLETTIHSLPPGAVDYISIDFINFPSEFNELLKFRMHSSTNFYDFPFRLKKEDKVEQWRSKY